MSLSENGGGNFLALIAQPQGPAAVITFHRLCIAVGSLQIGVANSDRENKRGNHHADVQLLRQMWTGSFSDEGFLPSLRAESAQLTAAATTTSEEEPVMPGRKCRGIASSDAPLPHRG